jgi:hypothetical protein
VENNEFIEKSQRLLDFLPILLSSNWSSLNCYQLKEDKLLDSNLKTEIGLSLAGDKILIDVFGPHFQYSYLSKDLSFYALLPYSCKGNNYPIDEQIAIYLLMFFMGELVRYQPEDLDRILESKEAWLLRSFIESCPLRFLRIITSKIMGRVIILERI